MAERRNVLRWGVAATLGLVMPGGTALAASRRGRRGTPTPTPTETSGLPATAFTEDLPIPTVLRPVSTSGGVDAYEIRQVVGRQRLRPGGDTPIWGYNGTFPGPTIEARSNRAVRVTHRNELPAPTVVHLHGAVVAPEHDGYPADYLLPVNGSPDPTMLEHAKHGVAGLATGTRTYSYPNRQPAATLWYHDHRMDFTGPQQYRGLAGFYLVRDAVEDALPLPGGARELPLMISDRLFNPDGSLFYPAKDPTGRLPGVTVDYHHSGVLGDTVLVNGMAWPRVEVDAALYRLRLVNASNARAYELALDPSPPGGALVQIGSDQGLLTRPVRHESFIISPGERYDVLVDFAAYPVGTQVVLRNLLGEGATQSVLRFDVVRTATEDARIPDVLAPEDGGPVPAGETADRSFSFFSGPEMTGLPGMINLKVFDPARIDARPSLNSTEIWDLTADPTHPVHLHLAHFRVLRRNGGPPATQDVGWKDTIYVPEGGVRVAVRFTGFRGKYVFHCHNLEHGDSGMMANLEVV